jgi:uncharacterized repeat protein (TIGR03803 family)
MKPTCSSALKAFLSLIVFALVSVPSLSAQTEKILYSFTGGTDGGSPQAGLVSDSKGNLYGTASNGGSSNCSCGTVFELTPASDGTWTIQTLYAFAGNFSDDGAQPNSELVFDSKGNLYGTTLQGGGFGFGTVFELSPGANNTWTEKVLYRFGFADGALPYGGVILDPAGNLYGAAVQGGTYSNGTIYELMAGSNGSWTEKTLYNFTGVNDGSEPESPLIFDAVGNLYGTTTFAGPNDYGSVFELKRGANGNWSLKTIYAFNGVTGLYPSSSLVFDSTGNLYGSSETTAFELMPGSNGTWTGKTLHAFTGGTDGANAYSGLTLDKKEGHLYGTTSLGGLHQGTVYELKPDANGSWTEKILHRFVGGAGDGAYPLFPNLLRDASGNLYGTTQSGGTYSAGVVYEVTP